MTNGIENGIIVIDDMNFVFELTKVFEELHEINDVLYDELVDESLKDRTNKLTDYVYDLKNIAVDQAIKKEAIQN